MRTLLTGLSFFILTSSFGQDLEKQKAVIDAEVERISKQRRLEAVNFSIQALKKALHYISYEYVENQRGYVKISRQFSKKWDTILQTFYLKDGSLVYATEKITTYYSDKGKTDSIPWSGNFYFVKDKLIDHVTLGHGKSEIDIWNPEQEMLTAYRESKRDIARYKRKKKGS
jgi:hypothetical protein